MDRPVKVLIVDDEELIRLNFRALLEDLDYEVAEAADGREGLEVFDREHPDIVLADLGMPVMNGLAMIAELREKDLETPVIVVSGAGTVRDAANALRLGAWDYMVKPVANAVEFEIIIGRTLEKAQLIRENRLYREHLEELVEERTRELRKREEDLREKSVSVQETNTALKVLLRHREDDKQELEDTIRTSLKELVNPYVEKLKACHMSDSARTYLEILELNLNNIASPFLKKVGLDHSRLTPTEILVADMVRSGRTTKEIAQALNLSKRTVESHRLNIRNKLGIDQKVNLQSYLRSMG